MPLQITELPLPDAIENGAVLVRVRCSTICGSDIHTIRGRRSEPAPLILGHEIVGEVVETGGQLLDMNGSELRPGDRITWSIMASCGDCFFCRRGLEQKCIELKKYGHRCINDFPGMTGGFAEYIYLYPGTAIVKIPAAISDTVAAPVNCALATAVHCVEQAVKEDAGNVLVLGAGLLGLNCTAYLKSCSKARITVTDVNRDRLETALHFGADEILDVDSDPDQALGRLMELSGYGFDAVIEVSGSLNALLLGLDAVRTGGVVLSAGLVTPGNAFTLDPNVLIRKCLTLIGSHNYSPDALGKAVTFLEKAVNMYPYHEIVGGVFPLDDINRAVEEAESGTHLRIAVM